MLIDLHTHTYPKSGCSNLKPEELILLSKQAGLDAVCLTEHDTLWEVAKAEELAREYDLIVLRGMEITTEIGHVLVFGLNHRGANYSHVRELREAVTKAGAVMILAHPFRVSYTMNCKDEVKQLFDAMEGINGTDLDHQNAATQMMCEELGMVATAGSDCHAASECGSCGTYFEKWITSEEELIAEVKAGRCRPVDLRHR